MPYMDEDVDLENSAHMESTDNVLLDVLPEHQHPFLEKLDLLSTQIDKKIGEWKNTPETSLSKKQKKEFTHALNDFQSQISAWTATVKKAEAQALISEMAQHDTGSALSAHNNKNFVHQAGLKATLTTFDQLENQIDQQIKARKNLPITLQNNDFSHAAEFRTQLSEFKKMVHDVRTALTDGINTGSVPSKAEGSAHHSSTGLFLTPSNMPFVDDINKFKAIGAKLNTINIGNHVEINQGLWQVGRNISQIGKNMLHEKYTAECQLASPHLKLNAQEKDEIGTTLAYLSGYQQARAIKNQLKNLASQLETKNSTDSIKLATNLRDFALFFDAQAKRYHGDSAAHDLAAHTIFMRKNLLKIFDEDILPGTDVAIKKSVGIKLGISASLTDIPGISKVLPEAFTTWLKISANATANTGYDRSVTIALDGRENYSYKKEGLLSFGGEGKLNVSALSSTASGSKKIAAHSFIYTAKSPDDISKQSALQKNNGHILSETILSNPKVRSLYQGMAHAQNKINKLFGFSISDPHIHLHTTINTLERASGSEVVMDYALSKLKIKHEQENSFPLHNLNVLSTGQTAASKAGTATAQKNPNEVSTKEYGASLSLGSTALSSLIAPEKVTEKALSGLLAGELAASYSHNLTKTVFCGTTLKPTHDLLSTTHTHSYKNSVKLAENIQEKVWQAKTQEKLPEHLKNTCDVFKDIHQPLDTTEKKLAHLTSTMAALTSLEENFSKFEQAAPLLMTATNNSVDFQHPYYRQLYNTALDTITPHQLDNDQILKKLPGNADPLNSAALNMLAHSHNTAQEIVGRVWDSYSTALGMLELTSLGRLNPSEDLKTHPELKEAIEKFVEAYTNLSKKIAKPNIDLSLDKLYRHAAIESPDVSEKIATTKKSEGGFSASLFSALRAVNIVAGDKNGQLTTAVGQSKKASVGIETSTKKSETTKTSNPLGKGESVATSWTGKVGGFATFAINQMPSNQGLVRFLTPNNISADALVAAVADVYGNNTAEKLTSKAIAQGAARLIDRDKNKNFSITATDYQGQLQNITLSTKIEKKVEAAIDPGKIATLAAATAGVPITASANASKTESRTEVDLVMMGPELSYQISQFGELAAYGIDKDCAADIKEKLAILTTVNTPVLPHESKIASSPNNASTPKTTDVPEEVTIGRAAIQKTFESFFEKTATDKRIQYKYFGLNSVGELLNQFSAISDKKITKENDGSFNLKGFELFNQNVINEYVARKSDEEKTSKNILNAPPKEDFFKTMGIERSHVTCITQSTHI
ncbi:MAG: hypothetical protein IT497_00275 [Ottowia sp.]|nr:hypothetical protein [Ottowia sp.]